MKLSLCFWYLKLLGELLSGQPKLWLLATMTPKLKDVNSISTIHSPACAHDITIISHITTTHAASLVNFTAPPLLLMATATILLCFFSFSHSSSHSGCHRSPFWFIQIIYCILNINIAFLLLCESNLFFFFIKIDGWCHKCYYPTMQFSCYLWKERGPKKNSTCHASHVTA